MLEHRKGVKHVNADALSRIQCDPADCSCYDGTSFLQALPCGGCSSCTRKHKDWSVLQEIDDVVPLISKRISVRTCSVAFYRYIGMYISVLSSILMRGLDYLGSACRAIIAVRFHVPHQVGASQAF